MRLWLLLVLVAALASLVMEPAAAGGAVLKDWGAGDADEARGLTLAGYGGPEILQSRPPSFKGQVSTPP
jgi:hypothetical protein